MELCCGQDSALSSHVQEGCFVIRITASMDIAAPTTKKEVQVILRLCLVLGVAVHVRVAIPCVAGCREKFFDEGIGAVISYPEMMDTIIQAVLPFCRYAVKLGKIFSWEWLETNLLWESAELDQVFVKSGASTCLVAGAAVGLLFEQKTDLGSGIVHERWRVMTDHPRLSETLALYAEDGALYSPRMAELVWSARVPRELARPVCSVAEFMAFRSVAVDPPCLPIWCCLVSRSASTKSADVRSDGAVAAVQKEMDVHSKRGNNCRAKSGRAPYEVFEEISNAPASFTAVRCALAVGFLKGMNATYRDAYQAYLQTRCDENFGPIMSIELPRE